ncbi:MAG: alpha-glucuronidase family glycosyl hydrolase, partial [Gemmatimonadota bacterium]
MHAAIRILSLTALASALLAVAAGAQAPAAEEDGYRLWLRYEPVTDSAVSAPYRAAFSTLAVPGTTPTAAAVRDELRRGLTGLLATAPRSGTVSAAVPGTLVAGTPEDLPGLDAGTLERLERAGDEGYVVGPARVAGRDVMVVAGNTDVGVLYGAFALLRHLQAGRPLEELPLLSAPRVGLRLLNHWDNLDRTVERGYAGFSLWDWHTLPD